MPDSDFQTALHFLDAGDEAGLRSLLDAQPGLARERVPYGGFAYFQNPSLLEFVAENPIRNRKLPGNIAAIARLIIDAGADPVSIQETLGLVVSGCVARECGVQAALIEVLCDSGANPDLALHVALAHGEMEAAAALLARGAKVDLPAAAALGKVEEARSLLASSNSTERHQALALASQHGHAPVVELLLDAGEDPSRFNPAGFHGHSTPLHQAALAGHADVVRLLVDRGARLDVADTIHHGTPLGWAKHAGKAEIAAILKG